jgi:uncharacterized protein (TIGR02145 family)
MRTLLTKTVLTAGFVLAMAFTFSCSDPSGGDGDNPSSSSNAGISSSGVSSSGGGGSSSSSDVSSSSSEQSSSSIEMPKCGGLGYDKATKYCSNGVIKTYGTMTDDDGNSYKTVEIGTQIWMAENLNYIGVNYGVIYGKCGDESTWTLSSGNTSTCDTYGRLYDWETANEVCPSGWRLPNNADWNILMKFVNPDCEDNSDCANAGIKLKSVSDGDNGEDTYGFAALLGGEGDTGTFQSAGYTGYWWSASDQSHLGSDYADYAYFWYMDYEEEYAKYYDTRKHILFSVRCVKE